MLSNTIAKYLESSPEWKELEAHIKSEVDSLSVIDGINFLDKESAAIEGRARQLAKYTLEKILEPFYSGTEIQSDKASAVKKKTGLE